MLFLCTKKKALAQNSPRPIDEVVIVVFDYCDRHAKQHHLEIVNRIMIVITSHLDDGSLRTLFSMRAPTL